MGSSGHIPIPDDCKSLDRISRLERGQERHDALLGELVKDVAVSKTQLASVLDMQRDTKEQTREFIGAIRGFSDALKAVSVQSAHVAADAAAHSVVSAMKDVHQQVGARSDVYKKETKPTIGQKIGDSVISWSVPIGMLIILMLIVKVAPAFLKGVQP